jgi:hypothetical protein
MTIYAVKIWHTKEQVLHKNMARQGAGVFSAMKIWHAKEQLRKEIWHAKEQVNHENCKKIN